MNRIRPLHILLAAALCLVLAGTALAATRKVVIRTFTGTTGQLNPSTNKNFKMKFKVSKGKVYAVDTTVRDLCPDGTYLRVHENAFKSATISKTGTFTLRAGTRTQPAVMKGKITGKNATGTISDKTNDTAGSGLCKASTTWTARVPATFTRCGTVTITPRSGDGLVDVRALGLSCGSARTTLRNWAKNGYRPTTGPVTWRCTAAAPAKRSTCSRGSQRITYVSGT
jgi:hypothetical protein